MLMFKTSNKWLFWIKFFYDFNFTTLAKELKKRLKQKFLIKPRGWSCIVFALATFITLSLPLFDLHTLCIHYSLAPNENESPKEPRVAKTCKQVGANFSRPMLIFGQSTRKNCAIMHHAHINCTGEQWWAVSLCKLYHKQSASSSGAYNTLLVLPVLQWKYHSYQQLTPVLLAQLLVAQWHWC